MHHVEHPIQLVIWIIYTSVRNLLTWYGNFTAIAHLKKGRKFQFDCISRCQLTNNLSRLSFMISNRRIPQTKMRQWICEEIFDERTHIYSVKHAYQLAETSGWINLIELTSCWKKMLYCKIMCGDKRAPHWQQPVDKTPQILKKMSPTNMK